MSLFVVVSIIWFGASSSEVAVSSISANNTTPDENFGFHHSLTFFFGNAPKLDKSERTKSKVSGSWPIKLQNC